MNGQMVEFENAKIHVLTHGLHYGSGAFEGMRCYETPEGPAIFRLREHMERLVNSCKVLRMEIPYSVEEMMEAVHEAIAINELDSCYIRPLAFRGFGSLGVWAQHLPVELIIAVWPWGAYLGAEALEKGVDVCVSSWRRSAPDTHPSMAKLTGNYVSSILIKTEAMVNGFSEGIALDSTGRVSEGSGENLFLVQNGRLITTPLSSAILKGITRDSVIQLARGFGLEVEEQIIPREMLYTCDELFFTGTAAEVTPIRSVDKIPVGEGRPGPITRRLMDAYLDMVHGKMEDRFGWLTRVRTTATSGVTP
jgi:branched-chain amino acid aminotransferase